MDPLPNNQTFKLALMLLYSTAIAFLFLCPLWSMNPPTTRANDEETFKKLFFPEYHRRLLEKDTKGAKLAARRSEAIDVSFIPADTNKIKAAVEKVLDEEEISERLFELPKFRTLDEAREYFKDQDVIAEKRQMLERIHADKLKLIKAEKESRLRSVFDFTYAYAPGSVSNIVSYFDPIFGLDEAQTKQDLEAIQADIYKRTKFIDEHPKWFLEKKYYNKDQYGLERAKAKLAKLGDGETLAVIDSFCGVAPERMLKKCMNPDSFTKKPEAVARPKSHGITVASVAVDSEIGVAPNAKFVGTIFSEHLAKAYGPLEKKPLSVNYFFDFSGDSILADHLEFMDIVIKEFGAKFAVKVPGEKYYIVDASDIKHVPQSVINLSLTYFDSIGNHRNSSEAEHMIKIITFAVAMLHYVNEGKLIVWAAGNHSMVVGGSKTFTLMKALSLFKPQSFISALSLDSNGTTLSYFTNQPGDHSGLQNVSLSAPGDEVDVVELDGKIGKSSGTSFAAPFISGAALLLQSNFSWATRDDILDALLKMASPVIMIQSKSRFGLTPIVLRNTRSQFLQPDQDYTYISAKGEVKKIFVTKNMIEQGRARYGVGIINVSGAATYLDYLEKNPDQRRSLLRIP